jgi:EAL domain-containing protein (putative c-di-GMP-specific phosphodiesterase class I)
VPSKNVRHMASSTPISAARNPARAAPTRPWHGRLRDALAAGAFEIHYQPIVSLRDRRVAHYEALVRLADDRRGVLVAPGRFLEAAERYGLVTDIDRLVLGRVIALLAAGFAGGTAREGAAVAVNLSALSVTDERTLGHIEQELAAHRVEPSRLILEITETAAISDMERARRFCESVQGLGCAVALDDFGAGYGSFHYLKHLPFTYLKIDGEFIRGLPGSRTDQLVVKAIAGVVRGMGRRTIAEFVGDETTLQMLAGYDVDYAQGFAIGRPRPMLAAADALPGAA